ncbi:MAG: hypothetical protein ABIR06_04245 [Cyclobacteriaceae bacterium]
MRNINGITMLLLFCMMTSCHDFSKSITKGKEINSDFLLANLKPDGKYVVVLKTGLAYKIKVKTIDKDSLSATFKLENSRKHYGSNIEDTISLQEIQEVKKEKLLLAPTLFAVLAPIGVGLLVLSTLPYSPITF